MENTAAPAAPSTCPLHRAYCLLIRAGTALQSPLLLAIRLYWGWNFFLTGRGKLMNLDRTTQFFTSLHIPFPKANVFLASGTECLGGLLLLIGLGSRLVSIPLIFVTIIAYVTAEKEALNAIFSDPDKFVSAAPFLFMFAAILVLAFGPGKFSVDYLIERKIRAQKAVRPSAVDA